MSLLEVFLKLEAKDVSLAHTDELASLVFTPNPVTKKCHRAWLSKDIPLELFMGGDTCKEAIDLASEDQGTPWTA